MIHAWVEFHSLNLIGGDDLWLGFDDFKLVVEGLCVRLPFSQRLLGINHDAGFSLDCGPSHDIFHSFKAVWEHEGCNGLVLLQIREV